MSRSPSSPTDGRAIARVSAPCSYERKTRSAHSLQPFAFARREAGMSNVVYGLCALTSLVCALLLLRSYLASRTRLLLWSTVCFAGLFANNVLLVIDANVPDEVLDLSLARAATALASVLALLVGLIWNASRDRGESR